MRLRVHREIDKQSVCTTIELLVGCLMAVLIAIWHPGSAEPVPRGWHVTPLVAPPARSQSSTRSMSPRVERTVRPTSAAAIPLEPLFQPAPSILAEYRSSADLYGFYLKHTDTDAWTRTEALYFVSQALEACFAVSMLGQEQFSITLQAQGWTWELWACQGFVDHPIRGEEIVDMLASAAEAGDPRARARMLLFRDIAAPLEEAESLVAELLATQDPYVIRDVGAFLGRGHSSLSAVCQCANEADLEDGTTESPTAYLIAPPRGALMIDK